MATCPYKPALMKHRVTLQERSLTEDGQGGYTEEWEDVASLWAHVTPLKGYERMQAMQLASPITHKVLIRYRAGLTTSMRLVFDGRVFEIEEAINLEEAKAFLQLICVENV